LATGTGPRSAASDTVVASGIDRVREPRQGQPFSGELYLRQVHTGLDASRGRTGQVRGVAHWA